jgi:DNA-binding transcriptional regulator YiaG
MKVKKTDTSRAVTFLRNRRVIFLDQLERYSYIRRYEEKNENTIKDGFPERLLQLRKQKNLSKTELGRQGNVHYSHVGMYERGISRPSADTLKKTGK